jgi:hypothetical protein
MLTPTTIKDYKVTKGLQEKLSSSKLQNLSSHPLKS